MFDDPNVVLHCEKIDKIYPGTKALDQVSFDLLLLLLIMIGMCTQERFFCQFLCPMGAIFAIMPIAPSALFNRDRSTCPAKCGACKKRCPAHLDIDGDTLLSGECICCHACQGICPKKNIRIGIPKMKDESSF